MFVHIEFDCNGNTNTYLFKGNESMVNKEIEIWKKRYILEPTSLVSGGLFLKAVEKEDKDEE